MYVKTPSPIKGKIGRKGKGEKGARTGVGFAGGAVGVCATLVIDRSAAIVHLKYSPPLVFAHIVCPISKGKASEASFASKPQIVSALELQIEALALEGPKKAPDALIHDPT